MGSSPSTASGPQACSWVARSMFFTIRTDVPPQTLVEPARIALRDIDPTLPMASVSTMEEVADRSVARPRLIANLLGSFALIALLLAVPALCLFLPHLLAG